MKAEIMISIIKSLTSGLQESEDKFSPLAKLDQMPFGVLCLNSLEVTNESEPAFGISVPHGWTGTNQGHHRDAMWVPTGSR